MCKVGYFGEFVDSAEDVEKAGFATSGIAQNDDKLALFDVERDPSQGRHSLQSKEVSFVDVISFDNVVTVVRV